MSFAAAVRAAMEQEMERDQRVFAYGEGINDPAGFFGTTVGLAERFGPGRCFDVPNSEETLTGFGLGAALGGLRPVFVNLRMEFLLLGTNQLVNHVSKWGAMHGRDLPVPFTIRAMVGRGWGQGAQHSGSYAAMLAHVPGLQVAVPSGPAQGAGLLISSVRGDRPTVLIEPKSIYESTDLLRLPLEPTAVGQASVRRRGTDFTIVSLGDGVQLALRVAQSLWARHGVDVEVVDACWLAPFDQDTVRQSVARTQRVGVVDIGWDRFGLASEVARAVLSCEGPQVVSPLLSWAPAGHAPAGCFAEARHYPSEEQVAGDILASLGMSTPSGVRGSARQSLTGSVRTRAQR